MTLSLEDTHFVAELFADDLLLEGKVRTPEKIMKKIDEVSVEDVTRVAKKIFVSQNLNLAIIGPYKEESRFLKILRSG